MYNRKKMINFFTLVQKIGDENKLLIWKELKRFLSMEGAWSGAW